MKLISCPDCKDLVVLAPKYTRTCFCGKIAGKYLKDNLTAVINKDALVVGIDNNGFGIAQDHARYYKTLKDRIDFFFTGWIPNLPGEVIVVESVEMVLGYDYYYDVPEEITQGSGTRPTESVEKGIKFKKRRIRWF